MSATHESIIPIVDLEPYLARGDRAACENVARAVKDVGVVILRDPRIPLDLPARIRELFLEFYRLPSCVKRRHERIDRHRQIGWTPPGETARSREAERMQFPEGRRPLPYGGPDVKERFSVPIGPAPVVTDFPELNDKAPEVPESIPNWVELTTLWGDFMMGAIRTSVHMAGIGLGMNDPELFVRLTAVGPHLLAPTGCDLEQHSAPDTVHSNFHTDMGFATIHGRSNYPGLTVWTRNRDPVPARLPDDGCLLLQVGKQWQICTGGAAHAGFHEVAATPEMHERAVQEILEGRVPWRVSSTLFCHVSSDEWLRPYDIFDTPEARASYPPIKAGERTMSRLRLRGLASVK